jgi:hypothetical protein
MRIGDGNLHCAKVGQPRFISANILFAAYCKKFCGQQAARLPGQGRPRPARKKTPASDELRNFLKSSKQGFHIRMAELLHSIRRLHMIYLVLFNTIYKIKGGLSTAFRSTSGSRQVYLTTELLLRISLETGVSQFGHPDGASAGKSSGVGQAGS